MREVIYVSPHGTMWKVKCDHCSQEVLFNTQADAIVRARTHVAELAPGSLSQIRVQRPGGQFRTEWTYGQDPFPPAG
jgi:hypothetical protein